MLLEFLTYPYTIISYWIPVMHVLLSLVQMEGQHPSELLNSGLEVVKIFTLNLIRLN